MKRRAIQIFSFSAILVIGFLLKGNSAAAQTYCTPSNTSYTSYGIDTVNTSGGATSDINNAGSGFSSSGYGNFTTDIVSVIQGDSINFHAHGIGAYYTYRWAVWVDWNNDGDFDDPGEQLYDPSMQSSYYLTDITFSIHVSSSQAPGNLRMRVAAMYIGDPTDCGSSVWGEWEDYTLQVMPLAPPNNAGVVALISPDSAGAFCSGTQPVQVQVSNLGNNPLNSVNVNWSVNGVLQTGQSLSFSPSIDSIAAPKHDTVITLGYAAFPFQTPVKIKAWTSQPNGVTDTDPSDDTLNMDVTSNMLGVTTHVSPQDTTICEGSSVTLDAGVQPAGVIFIWSNGALTQQTAVSQSGTYNVTVQSLQGCFAYDTVTVTVMPQPIAGTFGVVDMGGGNFQFTPAGMQNVTNYHWDFGDGYTIDETGPNEQGHHYAHSGTYAVTLTVSNGCGSITLTMQVFVQPTTGIKDAKGLAAALKLYPNPANDKLNIRAVAANVQLQQLTIYNMVGSKVLTKALDGSQAEVSIATLPAGMYQVIVQTNKGTANSKLEVQR